MSTVDSGKSNLTPPKQPMKPEDQKKLKEFLAGLEGDETNYTTPGEMIWDCLEEHGYKATKSAIEHIEASLIEESKNLLDELRKVLDKPANAKLKERWIQFNKQMGETPKVEWRSLPKKKEKESEHKAEDILTMIRQRQQSQ